MDATLDYASTSGQRTLCPSNIPTRAPRNALRRLNPALRDLAPIFNAGDLAVIHRAGYRSLSRSHFDSEQYWEKAPTALSANRQRGGGIWYRTIVEPLEHGATRIAGVSIQSNMPASLRGEQPMTNLSRSVATYCSAFHNASGRRMWIASNAQRASTPRTFNRSRRRTIVIWSTRWVAVPRHTDIFQDRLPVECVVRHRRDHLLVPESDIAGSADS
jgi:hypothetical protein